MVFHVASSKVVVLAVRRLLVLDAQAGELSCLFGALPIGSDVELLFFGDMRQRGV